MTTTKRQDEAAGCAPVVDAVHPERALQAWQTQAAHGVFEAYAAGHDGVEAPPPSHARFLAPGTRTPAVVRVSKARGRDAAGFAVKLCTVDGDLDLPASSLPVATGLTSAGPDDHPGAWPESLSTEPVAAARFWERAVAAPACAHALVWLLSDAGAPPNARAMSAFPIHAFRFVDDAGRARVGRLRFTPLAPTSSLPLAPEDHLGELVAAIASGGAPAWELAVQLVDDEHGADVEPASCNADVLDATKLLPSAIPVRRLGRLTLTRALPPGADVRTVFRLGRMVPGLELADDPIGQARARAHAAPRSLFSNAPRPWADHVDGARVRARSSSFADHMGQATRLVAEMPVAERRRLAATCVSYIVPLRRTQQRAVLQLLERIDADVADEVRSAL